MIIEPNGTFNNWCGNCWTLDNQVKSKEELIGDIITLLQSPAKNVISSLQSGGNKLAGIIKTLQEK